MSETSEANYAHKKQKVSKELEQHLRPELINRIDGTSVCHQLTEELLLRIADTMTARVRDQLRNRDMGLELTDSAKRFLVRKDWNPLMGARPLRRTIQREIEDFLSERILINELRPGQIAAVDCEGDPDDPDNARLICTSIAKVGDPDAPGLVGAGCTD